MSPKLTNLVAGVVVAAATLLGCGTRYADPIREEETTTDDPFVRRRGQGLWLQGSPYAFVGTVSWGIAWDPDGCNVLASQEEALSRTFGDLADARASVLKIWAFQSFAGASGTDYRAFDRIVAAARRTGIRLIFVLENHWADCSSGGVRDDAWYRTGHAAPYGDYNLSLPDYVRGLVTHFRDEPTVLAWEIMHEARGEDVASLESFAGSMASLIRENDPNHLIALGLDNGGSPATDRTGSPSNYERLHDHPAVDLLDLHDFDSTDASPSEDVPVIWDIAASLNKAAFAGATAIQTADASAPALALRADVVEQKLVEAMGQGFVGFLVYDYVPDWEPPSWSFDARPEEPLAGPDGVIARHAPATR
jgi:mannan endo-1,4-beta-mannosidase